MKTTTRKKAAEEKRIKPKFNSLDELFNFNRKSNNIIKTDSYDEYKKEIEKMNLADLQTHAISLSLKPSRNRAMLEKALLNNFSKYKASIVPIVEENQSKNIKNLDAVLKILSKGA